jgi:Brp/Blh family beta-carotene 15,15'-monooxygenase
VLFSVHAAVGERSILFPAAAMLLLSAMVLKIEVSPAAQVVMLALLVGLVGLPHGALDPLVAREAGLWRDRRGLIVFLLMYVALAAAALVLWIAAPGPCLLIFLLYSAFHFSGDWRHLPLWLRLPAGCFIVSAPAFWFPEETRHYFSLLADGFSAGWILETMKIIAVPSGVGMIAALFHPRVPAHLRIEWILLGGAVVVCPPLLFFLLYFCTIHSPRHLTHAARGLPARQVLPTALLFTLLTLALALFAFPLVRTLPGRDAVIQIVFVGLAILTVPHMLLVEYALASRTRAAL